MADPLIATDPESLGRAVDSLEGVAELRSKLAGIDAWLVGGAVRDLLRGEGRADLDLAVETDAVEVASRLGQPEAAAESFGTASVRLDGVRVDVARARRETYAHPGALPTVEPSSLADDLARRDFTVNAMALPLFGEAELVDPHGGLADLEEGCLRVLHPDSFSDDPTRALRAARYAARLGMHVEPATLMLLIEATDLATVSDDRVRAELRRIVAEETAPEALMLLADWGLAGVDAGAPVRLRQTRELLADPDWAEVVDPAEAAFVAATPQQTASIKEELTAGVPARPSEGVNLVAGANPHDVVAARIAGADWLDDWAHNWRKVALEISGTDLMAEGVPEGPAVGAGLKAALSAKLDGETTGRGDELRVAMEAAGRVSPSSSEG